MTAQVNKHFNEHKVCSVIDLSSFSLFLLEGDSSFDKLTEEQRIVAHLLKQEFESNGIHLTEEHRHKVVALQQVTTSALFFLSNPLLIILFPEDNGTGLRVC